MSSMLFDFFHRKAQLLLKVPVKPPCENLLFACLYKLSRHYQQIITELESRYNDKEIKRSHVYKEEKLAQLLHQVGGGISLSNTNPQKDRPNTNIIITYKKRKTLSFKFIANFPFGIELFFSRASQEYSL